MATYTTAPVRGVIAEVEKQGFLDTEDALRSAEESHDFIKNNYAEARENLELLQDTILELAKDFDISDVDTELEEVSVEPVSYPSAKYWGEIILNKAWPKNQPIKPTLRKYGNLDFKYLKPIPPKVFESSFAWAEQPYGSELRTTLAAAVYNELVNGGNGLPSGVHRALIENEQSARYRNQASQVRSELLATGPSGFVLGMGAPAQKGIVAEASKARVYADQDGLNAVTEIEFRYYQQNKEYFHTLSLEIEKLRSGDWDKGEQRRFEADKASHELALRAIEVNLGVFFKKWEGIRIEAETLKTTIEAIGLENEGKLKQYTAEHEANKTQSESVAAENRSKVEVRGIEVNTLAIENDIADKKRLSNLREAEFEYKQIFQNVGLELQKHGVNIEGYKAEGTLKSSILGAASKIAAQVAASLIGAMNVSTSIGYSGSKSVSRAVTDSASIAETHTNPGV